MTSLALTYFLSSRGKNNVSFMKSFHAHIYFESNDVLLARLLATSAQSTGHFNSMKLHEKPVGPHSTGMVELHFNESSYSAALEWIRGHRGVFSTLIHEDTGDDLKDHTHGICWLGPALPLDFGFFELIKARPELCVHQEST